MPGTSRQSGERWRLQSDDAHALIGVVLKLARHLEIRRREVLARHDLEIWEYDVLSALRGVESSDGLSPGELMAATRAASGTVTNRVDRLASRGFVSRQPDPRDGRGVLVRLRPTGRKRVDAAARDLDKAEAALWEALSQRHQAQAAILLEKLLAVVESVRS